MSEPVASVEITSNVIHPGALIVRRFAPRRSSRLSSGWHMLVGAGAASVDTAPSVCTTDVGAPMPCQFGAGNGFSYRLEAEKSGDGRESG